MREARQIAAIRLAVWGEADAVRRHLDALTGGAGGIDDTAAALAVLGLREEAPHG